MVSAFLRTTPTLLPMPWNGAWQTSSSSRRPGRLRQASNRVAEQDSHEAFEKLSALANAMSFEVVSHPPSRAPKPERGKPKTERTDGDPLETAMAQQGIRPEDLPALLASLYGSASRSRAAPRLVHDRRREKARARPRRVLPQGRISNCLTVRSHISANFGDVSKRIFERRQRITMNRLSQRQPRVAEPDQTRFQRRAQRWVSLLAVRHSHPAPMAISHRSQVPARHNLPGRTPPCLVHPRAQTGPAANGPRCRALKGRRVLHPR